MQCDNPSNFSLSSCSKEQEYIHQVKLYRGFNLFTFFLGGHRGDIQDYLDETAAVHEFRLPSKALLGLHAYCPVHFDAFHAVLVDITVHVSLLKMDCTSSQKVPRFV